MRTPMILFAIPVVVLGAVVACGGAREARRIAPPPASEDTVTVEAAPGDVIALISPPRPVHPAYAKAEPEAAFDGEYLELVERKDDDAALGFRRVVFELRARKAGDTEVVLSVASDDGADVEEYRYRVEIRDE